MLCRWEGNRLVELHSARTSVFGQRTFPVLHSTSSWRVTIYVGKTSVISQPTTNQANSAFHPIGVDKWVVSCIWIATTSVRGGAIWWTLMKEKQARRNLHVKLCDPCLSALKLRVAKMVQYKYSSFPFPLTTGLAKSNGSLPPGGWLMELPADCLYTRISLYIFFTRRTGRMPFLSANQ